MALNKIRELDGNSFGLTLPKDDLRVDGLVNPDGELDGEHVAHIQRDGPREYSIKILDQGAV